jgi:tetratricopeptide (TPR) repeat protein
MTYSYFSNDVTSHTQIYEMREKLGELLIDKPLMIIDEENQDYFMPRSIILAETIIKQVPSKLLKRVLNIFLDNLPPYKIINYRAFRKKAHDKSIINKAFPDWEEGKKYYEDLIEDDKNNHFLWQQGALYLSQKKQYNLAFIWIEQARNMSNNRVTSIKNSHAIILFDANINREGYEVQESLDRSMEILKDCYFEDKRKIYHAKRFAYQAINYYERFASDIGKNYLKQAENWLKDEIKDYAWDRELRRLLKEVENKLK